MTRRMLHVVRRSARAVLTVGAVVALGWLPMLAGCQQSEPPELAALPMPEMGLDFEPPPRPVAPAPRWTPPPRPLPELAPEGRSVQGRPIPCRIHGNGGETVLFLGAIHGNEPAGVGLCEQLSLYLAANPSELGGRRAVIVPAANPDGLAANTRQNARGVDLNRNFEASNRRTDAGGGTAPLSEPESRFIRELIRRYHPSCVIAIHQPLACVDYDGPAGAVATGIARACGLPVKKLGARPGSLGSFAGVEQGIAVVTLELPQVASTYSAAQLWRAYGRAMLAAVQASRLAEAK